MLTYDNIVKVNVSINQAVISPSKYATGLIIGPTAVIPVLERVRAFGSASEMLTAGYAADSPEYQAATLYFAQSPAPKRLYLASVQQNETALEVFQGCAAKQNDFYGVCVLNTADAALSDLAQAINLMNDFILFYDNSDEITSTAPALFTQMQKYKRALGLWHDTEYAACAVMGLCMGYMALSPDADFAVAYKALELLNPSELTEAQIALIKNVNGNVYVKRGNYALIEQGALNSGLRYNERMQLDRITKELGEACLKLLVSTPKLPQTSTTTARFINACTSVLNAYTQRGVLADGVWRGEAFQTLKKGDEVPGGYLIMADDYALQSDEDRALRKAVPLYIALTLSGNVESVVVNLNVQL